MNHKAFPSQVKYICTVSSWVEVRFTLQDSYSMYGFLLSMSLEVVRITALSLGASERYFMGASGRSN